MLLTMVEEVSRQTETGADTHRNKFAIDWIVDWIVVEFGLRYVSLSVAGIRNAKAKPERRGRAKRDSREQRGQTEESRGVSELRTAEDWVVWDGACLETSRRWRSPTLLQ